MTNWSVEQIEALALRCRPSSRPACTLNEAAGFPAGRDRLLPQLPLFASGLCTGSENGVGQAFGGGAVGRHGQARLARIHCRAFWRVLPPVGPISVRPACHHSAR